MKKPYKIAAFIVSAVVVVVVVVCARRFARDQQNIRALGNPGTRMIAMRYLGDHRVSRAVPALISIMKDEEDEWDKIGAAKALGKIGTREAIDVLIAEIRRESFVAPAAATGLFLGAGDERAVPVLLEALGSDNDALRKGSALALAKAGRRECVPSLADYLYDCNEGIDQPGLQALAKEEGVPHRGTLIARIEIGGRRTMAEYCVSKLREFTGESFGYDSSASKEERAKTVDAWRDWLKTNWPETASNE